MSLGFAGDTVVGFVLLFLFVKTVMRIGLDNHYLSGEENHRPSDYLRGRWVYSTALSVVAEGTTIVSSRTLSCTTLPNPTTGWTGLMRHCPSRRCPLVRLSIA